MNWKLMPIGRDDVCAGCGVALPAGTKAVWFSTEKKVRCVECAASHVEPAPSAAAVAETTPGSPAPSLPLTSLPPPSPAKEDRKPSLHHEAGGSAQREYERRSQRELAKKQQKVDEDAEWRRATVEARPVLGRLATALTPKPTIGAESQSTTAWKTGAEGERRVAEVLAAAVGVEAMHDLRMPGTSSANIDHIAVGPAGIYVIDAKKYSGGIEERNVGSVFRPDWRLYVNGRDRTKLADGVLGQLDAVRKVLGDSFAAVPVRGVLCFIGCEWGWIMKPKIVNGVTALWPLKLSEFVSAPGQFAHLVPAVAAHLRTVLKPAK